MRNPSLFKLSLIALSLLVICGCDFIDYEKGNGDIVSEKRPLEDFSEIQLTGTYEIGLKKGGHQQVVIVTDSNLMEFIDTEVEDGSLIVDFSKKISSEHGIKVYITYSELSKLKSIGASIIKTDGPIVSSLFELEAPGASLIDLEVDVTDLDVMLAGAGSVILKGRAENQTISLNGVGNLQAFDLESQSCKVTVSGMGGVEINVKENLVARVNGVGSIKYKGHPITVDDRVSGLGTINAAEPDEASL